MSTWSNRQRQQLPASEARCRRLAVVKPYGLALPAEVSELLPPVGALASLADEDLVAYEAALAAFLSGRWDQALKHLHRVSPDDQAKDLLTAFIVQHNRVPPAGWDGVVPLASKS